MTRSQELAESYPNGDITYVFEEIYRPLSNLTASMVMNHLPGDKQTRFWELNKEKMAEVYNVKPLT